VWLVVSDMPIYDGFLVVYMFCMLHVLYMIKAQIWKDAGTLLPMN
jgi:hypothetical protein